MPCSCKDCGNTYIYFWGTALQGYGEKVSLLLYFLIGRGSEKLINLHRIKDDRMENVINGSWYMHNLRQRGGCARRYAPAPLPTPPPPPPPLLHRVVAKQHCTNFAKHKILAKLFWISRNFVKFHEKFVKHEIKYFANISQNYKSENFCSHPTPTQSAVCCTNSRLLKQSFAAQQCYFEMKPIYAP